MKEKVLITGISGSGGSYLAEYILAHHPDVEVHGTVRWHSTSSFKNLTAIQDKVLLHQCDLQDLSAIIRLLRAVQPTKIFNIASHANVKVCFDSPIAVYSNNTQLVMNLLEAIRLECPETVFQQCSTSEVYGNPETTPITENHPIKPVNPYAASKLAQESLAYAYHKSWGLKVVITRMFAYINPRRYDLFATAFARQIAQMEKNKEPAVLRHGNLDSVRTLIDVRDAMRAYWIACEKCEYGVPYNIGGQDTMTVGDFLERLKTHAKVPIQSEQDPNLLRPIDVTKQIPDTSLFDQLTQWKPEYTLDESIEFLLDHCRKEA